MTTAEVLRPLPAMVGAEIKMVSRDTMGLLIPLGLPLLILVMNGIGTAGDASQPLPGTGGLTAFEVYVMPLALANVMTLIGVVNMPSFLTSYRVSGVLKRMSVTPVRPGMVLGAQVITSAIQTLLGLVLAMGAAIAFFDMRLPRSIWAALGVFVLASLTMYAVGMLVAAVSPTVNSAVAIGLVLFFAMGATGGMFGSVENLPGWMATVGETLPFGAAIQALGATWTGSVPGWAPLTSLGVALLGSSVLAARFFRWQ